MEDRWIRVILDNGASVLLKGATIDLSLGNPAITIRKLDNVKVGCFPLSRVIAVVDEGAYQGGCKKDRECCGSECNSP